LDRVGDSVSGGTREKKIRNGELIQRLGGLRRRSCRGHASTQMPSKKTVVQGQVRPREVTLVDRAGEGRLELGSRVFARRRHAPRLRALFREYRKQRRHVPLLLLSLGP